MLLTLLVTVIPFAVNALTDECFKARIVCFDEWDRDKDCPATKDYADCMKSARQLGVCPNDTVTVKSIHEKSYACGQRRFGMIPFDFGDFDDSHWGTQRATEYDVMYELVDNKFATFAEASSFCFDAGGSLFIPRPKSDFDSLKNYLLSQTSVDLPFWIGATDRLKEGEFRFEDGSTLDWDFFAPGEGPKAWGIYHLFDKWGRDCVYMDGDGLGYVRKCDETRNFICQYRGTTTKFLNKR